MPRFDTINSFLKDTQCADFDVAFLAGDASPRKYVRLTKAGHPSYIVMDAPPSTGEDIRPFVQIAQTLKAAELAPPELYKTDPDQGLILMQDFGDGLFFDIVEDDPKREPTLYSVALDVLDQLHSIDAPALSPYGIDEMAETATLAAIWYTDAISADDLKSTMASYLAKLDWSKPVVVLRDYHAQNLIWRPNETGLARVGLLDFQDAQLGHSLYDAASLLFDARRDVSEATRNTLLARLKSNYATPDNFDRDLSIISAQRNLRILGVFARLCIRDGKSHYIDLIPRVWRNLQRDIAHADLTGLADMVGKMPAPDITYLEHLRSKCATQ